MASPDPRIDRLLGQGGTARSRDLVSAGLSRSEISRRVAAGTLQRLRSEGYALHVVKTSEEPWEAPLDQIPVTDLSVAMRTLEEADETPEPAMLPGSLMRGTMRAGRR